MPMIDTGGATINVEIEGRADAPVLMLSNSIGTDLHMWDAQVPEFARHYRLVRYDRRGHGKSSTPKGPYSMEQLGRDVLAVIDALEIKTMNWCGLSMGGMVGQWLGANAPDRIEKLILSNTTDYYPDKTPWNDRIKFIREKGLAALADANMARWFTQAWRDKNPGELARFTRMFLANDPEGYIACGFAVRDMDHRALLPRITRPTLIIAGREDIATTPAMAESMSQRIPGAKLAMVEGAHIANAESVPAYARTVLDFLRS
jgi:3-oxoadipate enol-lactonase